MTLRLRSPYDGAIGIALVSLVSLFLSMLNCEAADRLPIANDEWDVPTDCRSPGMEGMRVKGAQIEFYDAACTINSVSVSGADVRAKLSCRGMMAPGAFTREISFIILSEKGIQFTWPHKGLLVRCSMYR